jgi:metal-dependent HD superfamily phosphatase/phosphodiesterase
MYKHITFEEIKQNEEIKAYVSKADLSLEAMGYTDHSFGHVGKCAETVGKILTALNYSSHDVELGQIAAYMHDIGNAINRVDHGQTGALMAFTILTKLGMEPNDIATIIGAIGNHDESAAYPINPITAALIIADKTDVRRSRVRVIHSLEDDIHDRVNYAVVNSSLDIDALNKTITLNIELDTKIAPVMEYFEIFLTRTNLSKLAASKLGLNFKLIINGLELI